MNGPAPVAVGVETACSMTGVGRTTLFAEMAAGRLRARKCGRRTIIETDELRRWVAALDDAYPSAA